MSIEEKQMFEIARLTAQVDDLQQSLRNSTSEADILRSSIIPGSQGCTESEQLQVLKAEVDHKCQKEKAIWAAIRHIAGEDVARRIEDEVSRRPIVAAPKARRRGTMPHMPAPHMTVVAKTSLAPKWPPTTESTPREPTAPSPEVPVEIAAIAAAPIETESAEEAQSKFDVDIGSVPPSVARQLFGGTKGKEQKEAPSDLVPLPIKLHGTSEPQSSRVAEVPSPMRRRETPVSFSWAPPVQMSASSTTPTAARIPRRVSAVTSPPHQVRFESSTDGNTTSVGSSVRDRIRQLELSSRRSSCQN